MNEKEIKTLLKRFFDGDTSLYEEQALYEYFASANASQDIAPLSQMFLDMSVLQLSQKQPQQYSHSKPAKSMVIRQRLAIAATIFATAGIMTVGYLSASSHTECEMIVYGKRVTRQEAVMVEVRHTMETACDGVPDIDAQLKEAFIHN